VRDGSRPWGVRAFLWTRIHTGSGQSREPYPYFPLVDAWKVRMDHGLSALAPIIGAPLMVMSHPTSVNRTSVIANAMPIWSMDIALSSLDTRMRD